MRNEADIEETWEVAILWSRSPACPRAWFALRMERNIAPNAPAGEHAPTLRHDCPHGVVSSALIPWGASERNIADAVPSEMAGYRCDLSLRCLPLATAVPRLDLHGGAASAQE